MKNLNLILDPSLVSPRKFEGVRGYLEAICFLRQRDGTPLPPGVRHNGLEGLVLNHGREWPYAPVPPLTECGLMRECFRNAAILAINRDLIYCEGWAVNLIPVEHAWCLTPDGKVVDNTWTKRPGTDYFGVAIKTDYLRHSLCRNKVYGLFYQPEHRFPILRDPVRAWKHPINRQ